MQDIMMDGNQMKQVFVNQKLNWDFQSATTLLSLLNMKGFAALAAG